MYRCELRPTTVPTHVPSSSLCSSPAAADDDDEAAAAGEAAADDDEDSPLLLTTARDSIPSIVFPLVFLLPHLGELLKCGDEVLIVLPRLHLVFDELLT